MLNRNFIRPFFKSPYRRAACQQNVPALAERGHGGQPPSFRHPERIAWELVVVYTDR